MTVFLLAHSNKNVYREGILPIKKDYQRRDHFCFSVRNLFFLTHPVMKEYYPYLFFILVFEVEDKNFHLCIKYCAVGKLAPISAISNLRSLISVKMILL